MSSVLSMKRHVKRYRFADEMISVDVVISSILGILSVLGTISIVIYGIIKRGTANKFTDIILTIANLGYLFLYISLIYPYIIGVVPAVNN